MCDTLRIVGIARTDFARNFRKEGTGLREAVAEVSRAAVVDAGITPADVQAAYVGSFAPGLFTRQLHLGALVADADPAWVGLPTMHVEAACASGGSALAAAADRILAGRADCVLVVGVEQQKTMPPREVGDVMAAAGDIVVERPAFPDLPIPRMFAAIAERYLAATGCPPDVLARVAVKNRAHARLNPLAQHRDKDLPFEAACRISEGNPVVAGPLKVSDCSPITDGAAAVILASDAFVRRRGPARRVRLAGIGQTTDRLRLADKDVPRFPQARRAAELAYAEAGLGPADLQGVEVHDCFSISELLATEALGLAPVGEGWRPVAEGATTHGGRVVVNAGGGLMGDGHPVGATGVRQVHEIVLQLCGQAGRRQIPAARAMAALNMGGTFTTVVVSVLTAE